MRGATSLKPSVLILLIISIHTPHAGSDKSLMIKLKQRRYFNPHSPCGERPSRPSRAAARPLISIHTPHAGSDGAVVTVFAVLAISIHTPHAGSDAGGEAHGEQPTDFNPHSPCGERLSALRSMLYTSKFQSTLPMRGATASEFT